MGGDSPRSIMGQQRLRMVNDCGIVASIPKGAVALPGPVIRRVPRCVPCVGTVTLWNRSRRDSQPTTASFLYVPAGTGHDCRQPEPYYARRGQAAAR